MAERDTLYHLVDEESKPFGVNSDRVFFQNFKQVLLDVFEDQVETALPKQNSKWRVLTV